jgi:hypothetical protein
MLGITADEQLLRHAVKNSQADRMRALEQTQRSEHKFLKSSRADIPFVRAAKSGQWRSELPPDAVRQIETAWGSLMGELNYLEIEQQLVTGQILGKQT